MSGRYDFICLSETKCQVIEKNSLDGFQPKIMTRRNVKHNFGGIHGICIYVRSELFDFVSEPCDVFSDCVLWLVVDCPARNMKFILGSVYIPHENSVFHEDDIFDVIANDVTTLRANYHGYPMVMAGDFNSRTGTMDDFLDLEWESIFDLNQNAVGFEVDNFNGGLSRKELHEKNISLKRSNMDKFINRNGRNLISFCKCLELMIVNGRLGEDKGVGRNTCLTTAGESTIDYMIVSADLVGNVSNFRVEEFDKCLSDNHCTITGVIGFRGVNDEAVQVVEPSGVSGGLRGSQVKTRWKNEVSLEYRQSFNEARVNELKDKLKAFQDDPEQTLSEGEMNDISCDLCQLLIEPSRTLGLTKNIAPARRKKVIKKVLDLGLIGSAKTKESTICS